jgi:protein SCO1/2
MTVTGTAAVAVALVVALAAAAGCGGTRRAQPGSTAPSAVGVGFRVAKPVSAPDFTLHDQAGKPVHLAALRGTKVVIAFLYVHCVDVCPLIAENLNQALRNLTAQERQGVRVLAISVDPKGDTPAAVRSYAAIHHLLPQFRYLIGSRAELEQVWRAYGVAAVAGDPGRVDHSAYELLVDAEGKGRVRYDSTVRPGPVTADIRALG